MPPPARHRLDILVLPADPDAPAATMEAAVARLTAAGLWPGGLAVGAQARLVVAPRQRFVANRQGGFYVRCPADQAVIGDRFRRALTAWREGGPRTLGCACGATHDLAALDFAPAAGFAHAWIEVPDVDGPELSPEAVAALGDVRIVLRRG